MFKLYVLHMGKIGYFNQDSALTMPLPARFAINLQYSGPIRYMWAISALFRGNQDLYSVRPENR